MAVWVATLRSDAPMTQDDELIDRARAGDRAALEGVVRASNDLVYNLAVRMLGDRTEAEDASQEILIRIVGSLGSFRGESSFKTWVYRVASNHLLTARKKRAEEKVQSFDALAEYLDGGIAADLPPLDDQVLVKEAKIRCTSKMLQCLDNDHRLAFVLGEILELTSEEGAKALEITSEAFRKRLTRARERMTEFMTARCGLVNPSLPCRCAKQGARAAQAGRLSLPTVQFANHPTCTSGAGAERSGEIDRLDQLGELERVVAVFRGHPAYASPSFLTAALLDTGGRPA